MAIVPSTNYSGQIDTSDSTAYPQGKAQNVTVAGDGTGTPLEKAWVNDLWGFLQALLDRAGITPSGDPDEVGASDYLDALEARYRTVHSIIGEKLEDLNTSPMGTTIYSMTIVWEPTQEKFYVSLVTTGNNWICYESTDAIAWSGAKTINSADGSTVQPAQIAYCPDNAKIGCASESGFHLSTGTGTSGFSATPTGTFSNISNGCSGLVWDDTNNLWIASGTGSGTNGHVETAAAAGVTWTQRDTEPASIATSIAHDRAGTTVVVYNGTDLIHYSTNGTTWTRQTTGMSKAFFQVWWCEFASVFVAYETTSDTLYWSADGDVWALCPFGTVEQVIVTENFLLFADATSEELHYAGSAAALKGDAPFINMGFAVSSGDLSPDSTMRRWQGSGTAFSYYNDNETLVNCTFGA